MFAGSLLISDAFFHIKGPPVVNKVNLGLTLSDFSCKGTKWGHYLLCLVFRQLVDKPCVQIVSLL